MEILLVSILSILVVAVFAFLCLTLYALWLEIEEKKLDIKKRKKSDF